MPRALSCLTLCALSGFLLGRVRLMVGTAGGVAVAVGGGVHDGLGGRVLTREQRGQIGPHGNACSTGQSGEVDDQVGLVLAGAGQRIGEDQAPFGIGIADLHRDTGTALEHVAGPEAVAGDGVFYGGYEQVQAHRKLGLLLHELFIPACTGIVLCAHSSEMLSLLCKPDGL